jgi:hypothetical protein
LAMVHGKLVASSRFTILMLVGSKLELNHRYDDFQAAPS